MTKGKCRATLSQVALNWPLRKSESSSHGPVLFTGESVPPFNNEKQCLGLVISQGLLLASHPLLKLQTAGVLRQLLRAKRGFQEQKAVEIVPRVQLGNSCEEACGLFLPLLPSAPQARRFAAQRPGWLPFLVQAAGRQHQRRAK